MLRIQKLSDCTFTEITNVWNEAFSNYTVNFQNSVDQLSSMIGKKDLLPLCSLVAFDGNRPIGFVLNAVKPINGVKTAWNGGTGVSVKYQGQGIGNLLMEATMDIYYKESVEVASLEVLTDNVQGVKLYERWGYEKSDTLISFSNNGMDIGNLNILKDVQQKYILKQGHVFDVKSIKFYNNQVAWESMCENIFNGHSLTISDQHGYPLGYALYKKIFDRNMNTNIILFQLESDDSLSHHEQESILNTLLSGVFIEDGPIRRTGDFISLNPIAYDLLDERGFKRTTSRFLMNKKF